MVREVVCEFRGLSGTAKQKAVLEATGLSRAPLSAVVKGDRLDREVVESLLAAMKVHSKPVKPATARLHQQGASRNALRRGGLRDGKFRLPPRHRRRRRRAPDYRDSFRLVPKAQTLRRLVSGVNWSPGILNPFRELGRFGASLDTILADQRANRNEPVVLVLHIVCPRVEYTDRGKSALV